MSWGEGRGVNLKTVKLTLDVLELQMKSKKKTKVLGVSNVVFLAVLLEGAIAFLISLKGKILK